MAPLPILPILMASAAAAFVQSILEEKEDDRTEQMRRVLEIVEAQLADLQGQLTAMRAQ